MPFVQMAIEASPMRADNPVMSTTLLYALIMAIAQIVVTLIAYFLGYQTDHMASGQWFSSIAPLVVLIVILTLGIKAVRDEQPGKGLSYGKGVGTGTLIVPACSRLCTQASRDLPHHVLSRICLKTKLQIAPHSNPPQSSVLCPQS